jgi:hypothetical protein
MAHGHHHAETLMEDTAGFDLNRAIADWRQQMAQSPAYRAEDLEELQAHVCDAVAALTEQGLSEEEAFLVTIRRLGSHRALEPEFARVNAADVWLHRLLWMVLGIQAWQLMRAASQAFGTVASWFAVQQLPRGQPLEESASKFLGMWFPAAPAAVFLLGTVLMLATLLAACWFSARRMGRRLPTLLRPGRSGWTAAGICLGVFTVNALGMVADAWVARHAGAQTFSTVMVSRSWAGAALFPVQTIGFAWLTVLLARRHLQRTTA